MKTDGDMHETLRPSLLMGHPLHYIDEKSYLIDENKAHEL